MIHQFFDISLEGRLDNIPQGIVANQDVLDKWKSIFFDPLSDSTAIDSRKPVSLNNVVVEVLFASSTFASDVEVGVDKMLRFYKISSIKHEVDLHYSYLDSFMKKRTSPSFANVMLLVLKCIILRDTFCSGTNPICCQHEKNAKPLSFFVQKQKNALASADGQLAIIDSIFNGYLDLKNSLAGNPDRLNDLILCYRNFLLENCDNQNGSTQILNSLRPNTIARLQKDFESSAINSSNTSLVSLLCYDLHNNYGPNNQLLSSGGWEPALVKLGIPELIAKSYANLTSMSSTETIRYKILERFESLLTSKSKETKDQSQELFQKTIGILAEQNEGNIADGEKFVLAYFDILNLANSNLRTLFRVNVQLLFLLQQTDDTNMELEEGEEFGMGTGIPDDVTATALMFRPHFNQICSDQIGFSQKADSYEISPNILIFHEILQKRPESIAEFQRLQRLILDYWNFVAIEIPSDLFQQSLEQLISQCFGTNLDQMVDYVFVKFIFSHFWVVDYATQALVTMLSNEKFEYSISLNPIRAFIEHFSKLDAESDDLICEISFIDILVCESLKLLPTTGIKKKQAGNGKKRSKLGNEGNNEGQIYFKFTTIQFLSGLLAAMPIELMKSIVGKLVPNLKGEGNYATQYLLVSIMAQLETNLSDIVLDLIFPAPPQHDDANFDLKSWDINFLSIILKHLGGICNVSQPTVSCRRIMGSFFSNDISAGMYTNLIRERVILI